MQLTQELIELLNLEKLEEGLYRGQSRDLVGKRVFGGQLLGQALRAASYSADRPVHSLHAYFLSGGDARLPIIYQVEKTRDGQSFLNRIVKAIQNGRLIFQAMVSFVNEEDGLEFQVDMPDYALPEQLPNEEELKQAMLKFVPENWRTAFLRRRHIEITPIDPTNPFDPQPAPPSHAHYMRTWQKLPAEHDEQSLHQAIVAFCSDFTLMTTCLRPHGISYLSPQIQCASLDHAIYFHQPVRADEWFLHDMIASQTHSSRGLNFGKIWQNGRLVASTVQEGLIRLRDIDFSKG